MNLQPATPKLHVRLDTRGARIRAVREAAKLTVNDASKVAGVSRQTFTKWQKDEVQECDIVALGKFCVATDITLDWLVTGRGPKPGIISMNRRTRDAARNGGGKDDDDGNETWPIPEITGSMVAHARQLDLAPVKHWTVPDDVLTLVFNSEPDHVVMQRVTASDRSVERGDYLLIDISRVKFDDAGTYLVTTDDADAAFRVELEWVEGKLKPRYPDEIDEAQWNNLRVLGRVMALMRPT